MREHVFTAQILALVKEECSIKEVFGEDAEEEIKQYLRDTGTNAVISGDEYDDIIATFEAEALKRDARINDLEEEVTRLNKLLSNERKRKAHHVSPTRR